MKQRLILFSALLIMSLLLGIASADETDSDINVTYSKTSVVPGDVVNITADFNTSVDHANISITSDIGSSLINESMDPLDTDDNSFIFNYTIPVTIISGPLDVDISAFDVNDTLLLDGQPLPDNDIFVFDPENYLDIVVKHNGTGNFRPGDFVNITANFSKPVDHANISIASTDLPGVSNANLVGADLVTDDEMTPLDDSGNTFGYDYEVPEGVDGPLDMDVSGFDDNGNLLGDESFPDEFNVGDPYITVISPISEFASKKNVDFNFTANDDSSTESQIVYTFWLDGVQVNNGVITSGAYKQLQFDLADGKHTWEVKTKDSLGEHTTGTRTLYVDTKCPSVTLVSPQDCFKQVIGDTQFNFTCEDALAAQYSDLGLTYTMYIDGQVAKRYGNFGNNITGTAQSGVPVTQTVQLDDGAHNWSVSVQDGAGNSITSQVRKFYVDLNGLTVSSVSPNGVFVPKNPTFNFTVNGGAGLPFTYKLLVDGKEATASCDCDCDCSEGYSGDEGENGCVKCTEGKCDGSCFVVGKDIYSIKAAVADGVNKNWTVIITDSTTGKTYQTDLKSFSVDSVAPACVANLQVEDALGQTYWQYVSDYPGLMVSWNASTDTDLADMPYEVYISSSKPSCIEDMQKVNTTGLETHTDGSETPNQKLENSSVTDLCIEAIDGKDLVYGKDYWVAVIARDNASNYNSDFSKCGPVQTYEDMAITLEEGWNLKSVPKALVASNACPEDVFGSGSTVLYWDGSCWQFPETIEPCKGYWVYTEEPLITNVKFKGMSSNGANPDVPASLELTAGWHMIGHTSSYYAPWSTTLSSLNDFEALGDYRFSNLMTYGSTEGWGGIIPSMSDSIIGNGSTSLQYISGTDPRPVGALQTDGCMVPGQGYWIFMKDKGTYASIENSYKPDLMSDYSGTE